MAKFSGIVKLQLETQQWNGVLFAACGSFRGDYFQVWIFIELRLYKYHQQILHQS